MFVGYGLDPVIYTGYEKELGEWEEFLKTKRVMEAKIHRHTTKTTDTGHKTTPQDHEYFTHGVPLGCVLSVVCHTIVDLLSRKDDYALSPHVRHDSYANTATRRAT